jgi:hypothetical protein
VPSATAGIGGTPSSVLPTAGAPGIAGAGALSNGPATNLPVDPAGGKKLAMDECDLHTPYPGDEYCIKPPPADKGFQIHIGPADYNNPEAKYVLQPGQEDVVTMSAVSGNTTDIKYYYRQYRMRPGSHHVIVYNNGRRLGGTQNLAKDNPDFGLIPPESEGVGIPLAAKSPIDVNMHYYNFGDKPIIREVWINFWYKDPATVTETAAEIFSMTGVSAAVAHSHTVVGASCTVSGTGRALTIYGHRHLNNVRFSAWRNRGSQRDLVFEDYDPAHPTVLEYNSLTTNMPPDKASKRAGGWNGPLDLKAGDTMEFECEIVNNTNKNFTGANEAADDEMCILVGDTVGATISGLPGFGCTAKAAQRLQ